MANVQLSATLKKLSKDIALKDGQLVFEGLPQQIDDAEFKAIYGQEAERVSVV